MTRIVDAVIVGAGPNGLVAANVLADRGWDVVVLEAEAEPGGAVRSAELLEPGFVTDRFSAFYPLSAVSPHIAALDLERFGLVWSHAPDVLAHPTADGTARLSRDIDETAASLDGFSPGDGAAWHRLQQRWSDLEPGLIDAFMGPFPPIRAAGRLASSLGVRGTAELARDALVPVGRFADERFRGDAAALLLAGSALHADVTPTTALSGLLGWLLTGIGQQHGWPVPRGGAGELTAALVRRLDSRGGRIECDRRVTRILTDRGGACGVETADGERVAARHGVIADVVAPTLYLDLVDRSALPATTLVDLGRYQRGSATFKVNWTLDGPIPWSDPMVGRAGTVHLADSMDELTMTAARLATGHLPERPFVLLGQMTTADPSRSPAGTETVWAYTDVPQDVRGDGAGELHTLVRDDEIDAFANRIQQRIEDHAPGFGALIRHRSVQSPYAMQSDDANLLRGDKNLGTAQLHQQLIFRPTLGLARAETPIPRLFLASASAHPGGGVHGACGANAARAAIAARRWAPVARSWRVGRWRRRVDGHEVAARVTSDRGAPGFDSARSGTVRV
jgi:phytoene dehydrogenase-like protein